jgi:hypothetical protein
MPAGFRETDGREAIEAVTNAFPIDPNRIVMAGSSMGGASAWSHIVHFADRWVWSAGCGVTRRKFPCAAVLRASQNAVRDAVAIYDLTDTPSTRSTSPSSQFGEIDAQKQAADAMARCPGASSRTHHRPEHGACHERCEADSSGSA